MLQGYWQVPLGKDAQTMFTMVTPNGLSTPRRVPPGMLNHTGYFQATLCDVFEDTSTRSVGMDVRHQDLRGGAPEVILKRLIAVLDCLLICRIFAAAHKAVFFRKEIKWYGKSSPDRQ